MSLPLPNRPPGTLKIETELEETGIYVAMSGYHRFSLLGHAPTCVLWRHRTEQSCLGITFLGSMCEWEEGKSRSRYFKREDLN